MKILVLAPPMDSTGGVQSYTATLVRSLEHILGTEDVRVVAVSVGPQLRDDGELALSLGTKVRFFAAAMIQALIWHPKLIICGHIGVAPAALVIKQVSGIPYWIVLHGIEVWGELPNGKGRALRGAERLICNSHFTSETASARHQLSGVNVVILPPAFKVDETQNSIASSLEVETAPPIVLTVGRLAASERYKGHDIMLDSWTTVRKKIPNAVYCIIGDGDDRARLEARAQGLGLSDSVRFTGAVSGLELNDWYHRCRVFAMPARTELDSQTPRGEGFGIVFLEAMAHGKPILGPSNGAPSEFIHSGEHGLLVDPTDPSDVANAIVELLGDKERANHMGQAAQAWVICEYSEEKFRQRLREILENKPVGTKKNH